MLDNPVVIAQQADDSVLWLDRQTPVQAAPGQLLGRQPLDQLLGLSVPGERRFVVSLLDRVAAEGEKRSCVIGGQPAQYQPLGLEDGRHPRIPPQSWAAADAGHESIGSVFPGPPTLASGPQPRTRVDPGSSVDPPDASSPHQGGPTSCTRAQA